MNKDLLTINDLNKEEILEIVDLAFKFKKNLLHKQHASTILQDKAVVMIFDKQSLRTKMSYEIATQHLGGAPLFFLSQEIFNRESNKDIAKTTERFADLIVARVSSHSQLEEFATNSKIPVINALCDHHHPSQALADLMAMIWHKGDHKGLKVAYVGDGNNVAISLMQMCVIMGIEFSIATPKGYEIPQEFYEEGTIEVTHSPEEAMKNADVVYMDTFISMGEDDIKEQKLKDFECFKMTPQLMKNAKNDALFMHCLPQHGHEVSEKVLYGPQSIIYDQAECKLHIAKALLATYINNS